MIHIGMSIVELSIPFNGQISANLLPSKMEFDVDYPSLRSMIEATIISSSVGQQLQVDVCASGSPIRDLEIDTTDLSIFQAFRDGSELSTVASEIALSTQSANGLRSEAV
jgi:hypothetical protein